MVTLIETYLFELLFCLDNTNMVTRTQESINKLIAEALESRDEKISDLERQVAILSTSVSQKNEKLKTLSTNVEWLTSANLLSDHYRVLMLRKIDQNEQYSRKQNIIVDGMKISRMDSDDNIRNMILAEINRLNLDIQDFEVVRAHRTGRSFVDKQGKRHTPVIVRFLSWRSRDLVYQARKDSNLFFKADLTEDRNNLLEEVKDLIDEEGSVANELLEYAFADRNCNLKIKSKDQRYKSFNSMSEFQNLLVYLNDSQPPTQAINKLIESDKRQKYTNTKLVNVADIDLEEWVKDPTHIYI